MPAPSPIDRLFAHAAWADDLVQRSLEEARQPPERALDIYAHVVGAELIWLDRLEGKPQSVEVWPAADVSRCRQLGGVARSRYAAFLEGLTDADLTRPVVYTNSAGREFTTPLGDILVHVALHGAYHRGQVALLLRDADAEPAPTDYIAFIRGAPAATRADTKGERA